MWEELDRWAYSFPCLLLCGLQITVFAATYGCWEHRFEEPCVLYRTCLLPITRLREVRSHQGIRSWRSSQTSSMACLMLTRALRMVSLSERTGYPSSRLDYTIPNVLRTIVFSATEGCWHCYLERSGVLHRTSQFYLSSQSMTDLQTIYWVLHRRQIWQVRDQLHLQKTSLLREELHICA